MPNIPKTQLTEKRIKKLAGATIFERGYDYYQHGHVREVLQFGDHISARVVGSRMYSIVFNYRIAQ